jgi:hypothetical protein
MAFGAGCRRPPAACISAKFAAGLRNELLLARQDGPRGVRYSAGAAAPVWGHSPAASSLTGVSVDVARLQDV